MRLEAAHVSFRYGRKGPWILEDLSLAVESGQRLGLFAPSGYGKSTLARLLAGYLAPQKGKILLDGAALPKKGVCPVQLICQHPEKAINPRWRLKQVLEESGKLRPDVLASFGIETAWLDRFPRELSGGERQRVYLAMALAQDTGTILLDEPTAFLDLYRQFELLELLRRLCNEGKAILIVLHDLALALQYSDQLVLLEQGRMAAVGTPEQIVAQGALDRVFRVQTHRAEGGYWFSPAQREKQKGSLEDGGTEKNLD